MEALRIWTASLVIEEADGPTSVLVSAGVSIVFLILIFSLLFLAARILLGLAAYSDARSKGNADALMWGLLIGFLGLIPGVIYLCIRNSAYSSTVCLKCGFSFPAGAPSCPRCGEPNPYFARYSNPAAEHQARQAKTLFIVGLILMGVGILAVVVAGAAVMSAAFSTVPRFSGYGY